MASGEFESYGSFVESVGIEVGKTDAGTVVVGLLFPTTTSEIDGVFEARHMPLTAAKELLLDLRDAVEEAERMLRDGD